MNVFISLDMTELTSPNAGFGFTIIYTIPDVTKILPSIAGITTKIGGED